MILKELLVQYEIQNNLSHAEVAEEVGVSLSTYYRWISGESTKLKKTTIQKLSKVLDCDIEEVIEETIIEKVIDSEQNLEILKILHSLEEPYKEVFTLRIYGELSFKQIGEIFDKNEKWARVTYYRSKLKIKENLK